MLAVVAEESRRWNCIAIGEDLGTVPENFRATLSAWGVWSYLVVLFERNWDGSFRRPDEYPERAIATFNTHDLPTFAGWMSSHDLRTKRAINVDPGETEDDRHNSRVTLCAALAAATGSPRIGFEDVAAFLAATPTRLVSIAIEDVLALEGPGQRAGHGDRASELAAAMAGRAGGACVRSAAAPHRGDAFARRPRLGARILIELAGDLLDRVERRQAGFVAEMLDLVGRGVLGKPEMLLPAFERIVEIGIHIGAVEHVARAAGVAHAACGTGSAGSVRTSPLSSYQSTPRSPCVTPPILQPRLLR